MRPDTYEALCKMTEEAVVGGRPVRLDPDLQWSPGPAYGEEELASLLRAAAAAKDQIRAEAYYCKFVSPPRPVGYDGPARRCCVAIYLDEQYVFILSGDVDVESIVNSELRSRTA
jgi:hypothetical protein